MSRFLQISAAVWLIFLISFLLGFFVYDGKIWPYQALMDIKNFTQGHSSENLTLKEKIENDLNVKPSRHIKISGNAAADPSKFIEIDNLKLNPRRQNPTVFLSERALKGYRVIYGTFDFEEILHGAIMLGPDGDVTHIWLVSQDDLLWFSHPDSNVFPHGFEIAPDGSIITAYDSGSSLAKYDYCGNVLWRIPGSYHHSIQFADQNSVWVWRDEKIKDEWVNYLTKVDYGSGKILKSISMLDVLEINNDIDIFGIRQLDTGKGSTWVDDGGGRWHPNDIDPLPENLASHYPDFEAGDLLVSLRSPNLIFVLDPETYRVKWWRQGLVRRQHDPDWNDRGTITIFNNNMHRESSNIVEIDPVTYEHNIILDGKPYEFYTWWRGKHQMLDNGGVLITSSDQGRVFETDSNGEITFEFINRFDGNQKTLAISEARFLPADFFEELPSCSQ